MCGDGTLNIIVKEEGDNKKDDKENILTCEAYEARPGLATEIFRKETDRTKKA